MFSPQASCLQKKEAVAECLQSLDPCEGWANLYKTGKLLSWCRILGLALEQALLWYVATGVCSNAVGLVLVRGVRRKSRSEPFDIAVSLGVHQQQFIEQRAVAVFEELWRWRFMCAVGVDVPYTAMGGQGEQRRHDLLGTFCAGSSIGFTGVCTIETFLTQGAWNGDAVKKKRNKWWITLAMQEQWSTGSCFVQLDSRR